MKPITMMIKPELMYPHKANQKISVSGLTVEDLHWLQNVPKCRDVQLLVVHVGVNTCWVNTVTESMWRALLKLLKSVFPNADVQISPITTPPPLPQGEHPLRKTKACHSEQVMLADHTDTFTTNSVPSGKRSTVTLCTQAPMALCDLRATSSMWANPDLPFDPETAFPIRHPLLVAECRCWRPLRFSHVLAVRQASSTEMGHPFQPLAVLSHHLHCYNNSLQTRKAPAHNDGRVTPHYTTSLTATAEDHPYTVMLARSPVRYPSVAVQQRP